MIEQNISSTQPAILREEDRIVATHIHQYPSAPRPVVDRWLYLRNRNALWIGVFPLVQFIFAIYLLPHAVYAWQQGQPVSIRVLIFLVLSPINLYILWFFCVVPLYHWWLGTTQGRPAIAQLIRIDYRGTPVAFRGVWRVEHDGATFEQVFGVNAARSRHETWVQTIEPGDHIHVLMHPTKNTILLAYGPVEAYLHGP